MTNTTQTKYYAHVNRMMLTEINERYVELDEDESTGMSYSDEFFADEGEAIDFAKSELDEYDKYFLGGKGYKVVRTRQGLDTIQYATATVERMVYDEDVEGYVTDDDYSCPYYGSTLPTEVHDKAMQIQRGYHAYLDYEGESYGSLYDMLED